LEDDDETVVASNVSEGCFGEENIGMETAIPKKQDQKPVHILNMSIPSCFPNCEKPEQVNKIVATFFLPNS